MVLPPCQFPPFQDETLLQQALTHSSYAHEHSGTGDHYERLEFLGDSILEFVVRDLLFSRFPAMAEGEMSKRADVLVDEPCLADLAVQMGIPDRMRLGAGAQHERHNPGVQADMFEAVIGAYRIDAGLDAVYSYVQGIFGPLMDRAMDLPPTDPVSAFQEYVQAATGGASLPEYRVRAATGPDHAKEFTVEVYVGAISYGLGQGHSKKAARRQAAMDALGRLKR
jgi:ribonuclease III